MRDLRVAVIGAGSLLGCEIIRELTKFTPNVIATYRTSTPTTLSAMNRLGVKSTQLDIMESKRLATILAGVDAAIFIPVLSISSQAISCISADKRVIFFSSHNVLVDKDSKVYERLRTAESDIQRELSNSLILRPTMIYGYHGDGNISRLLRLMNQFPVIPFVGSKQTSQQPIFYKDLAHIAARAIVDGWIENEKYVVAGPSAITKWELYKAVAAASGKSHLFIPIPNHQFAIAIVRYLEKLGLRLPLSSDQLARIDLDKAPASGKIMLGDTTLEAGLAALKVTLDDALWGH